MSTATSAISFPGLWVSRKGGDQLDFIQGTSSTGFSILRHHASYGTVDFQYFIGDGFQIWRSRYAFSQKVSLVSAGEVPILELQIPLSGHAMNWWDGERTRPVLPRQFGMGFAPFVNSETIFEPQVCETLDIHYTFQYLLPFCNRYPFLEAFLESVERKKRADLMGSAVRFLNPRMMECVHRILGYTGGNVSAADHYAAEAGMLLELVLERIHSMRHDYCTRSDIAASADVRSLIETNPGHSYSTAELSAYTGISASKLRKCFRELHGVTLFDFSQGVRLHHAQRLLLDTRFNLQEIAEQCGYPEHANFTAAFRNRFGVTPQAYRMKS